ncbi:unnamed protein product [Brassica rapa subsp. trilocularis]
MILKATRKISSVDLSLAWRLDLVSRKVDKVDWRVRNSSHVPASLAFSLFTLLKRKPTTHNNFFGIQLSEQLLRCKQ